jgi:hypothetical protein
MSNVMKIWEPKPPETLWATPGLLQDSLTLKIHTFKNFKDNVHFHEHDLRFNTMSYYKISMSKHSVKLSLYTATPMCPVLFSPLNCTWAVYQHLQFRGSVVSELDNNTVIHFSYIITLFKYVI